MIPSDDFLFLFATIILWTFIAWLVVRLIVFIPSFMVSLVRKVKNNSMIYSEKNVLDPDLDPDLDKGLLHQSDFGLKYLWNKWK